MSELPQVDGVTHSWVRARGTRFHVAEAGSGDDVVLCLHGWPQHWFEWRHVMPALADRHRVLALDLRGFGWSDATRDGYLKEDMASDVLAVLDELGIERVKLVGHDWGGWIGFLLCMREPRRFERFLALNIIPPWIDLANFLPHAWRFWYQQVVISPGLGYRLHRQGRFVRRILSFRGDPKVWDEGTLSAFADNLAEPGRARAAVQIYRVFNLQEVWSIVQGRYAEQRLEMPVRLVFGADDFALRPELLAGAESHGDDFEIELVPGCGHFIVDERPDLVVERARAFLGDAAG